MGRDDTEPCICEAWDHGPQGCWAVVKVGAGKSDEKTAEKLKFNHPSYTQHP